MANVFNPGDKTTEDDLVMEVRDAGGNLIDPHQITYSVYKVLGTSSQVLISDLDLIPIRKSLGVFYPKYDIPSDSGASKFVIKWNIRETSTGYLTQFQQEFQVIRFDLGDC